MQQAASGWDKSIPVRSGSQAGTEGAQPEPEATPENAVTQRARVKNDNSRPR